MFSRTFSATHLGLGGSPVEIETTKQRGLPQVLITGLAGEVVRESRERIRACLQNLGFDCPSSRLVVHLSPAQTKKQGSQLDLAIAIALLAAEGCVDQGLESVAFLGEIALDGKVRKIARALALIESLSSLPSVKKIYLPQGNLFEAQISGSTKLYAVDSLGDVLGDLRGSMELVPVEQKPIATVTGDTTQLDRVYGQNGAKRAIQIAVAGHHHLLMSGPPGVGKSSLADCVAPLLPRMSADEARGVLRIHDATTQRTGVSRPFRSPHHSISTSGLLGGGSGGIIAGEVTLAHRGVLFLDELPLFRTDLLEGLREPLQSEVIHIHRIGFGMTLPASFLLIAAMNPCPCGLWGDRKLRCRCSPEQVVRYQARISGPIMERIDISIFLEREEVAPPTPTELCAECLVEGVSRARSRQQDRITQGRQARLNGLEDIRACEPNPFTLGAPDLKWFETEIQREHLSMRMSHKLIRIARTIADIAGEELISRCHLEEAQKLCCRRLSRLGYGFATS